MRSSWSLQPFRFHSRVYDKWIKKNIFMLLNWVLKPTIVHNMYTHTHTHKCCSLQRFTTASSRTKRVIFPSVRLSHTKLCSNCWASFLLCWRLEVDTYVYVKRAKERLQGEGGGVFFFFFSPLSESTFGPNSQTPPSNWVLTVSCWFTNFIKDSRQSRGGHFKRF